MRAILVLAALVLAGCDSGFWARQGPQRLQLQMYPVTDPLFCIGGCGEESVMLASSDPNPTFECDNCRRKHEKWSDKDLVVTETESGWECVRCPECMAEDEPHCIGTKMVIENLGDSETDRQSVPAIEMYCSGCKNHFAYQTKKSSKPRPITGREKPQ